MNSLRNKSYTLIYPKNWNESKFYLTDNEIVVTKGEAPDYVVNFCSKFGIEIIDFDDFDFGKHIDDVLKTSLLVKPTGNMVVDAVGCEVPEVEFDWESMWTSWDEIEDYKTLYIEANPMNICTTVNMFSRLLKRARSIALKEIGYDIKLLIWEDDIPFMKEGQINFLSKKQDFEAEMIKFDENFPYPRMSLAKGSFDIMSDAKNCHIISDGYEPMPIYRRYFLNKKLNEKYGEDLVTNCYYGDFDKCIISHPVLFLPVAKKYHYDRTDNWASYSTMKESDYDAILAANSISCSSKWLVNDTKRVLRENNKETPVYYIPNGNVHFDYPENVEKFERKTAIYVGNNLAKVDVGTIFLLADMHQDWDFRIYANQASELNSFPENVYVHEMIDLEDLFPIICKCHLGLIIMKSSDWTLGMLSNKFFNYVNAKIPTLYYGCPDENYEDYKEVAFSLRDYPDLDVPEVSPDVYAKYERSWDDVCKEVEECLTKLDGE